MQSLHCLLNATCLRDSFQMLSITRKCVDKLDKCPDQGQDSTIDAAAKVHALAAFHLLSKDVKLR